MGKIKKGDEVQLTEEGLRYYSPNERTFRVTKLKKDSVSGDTLALLESLDGSPVELTAGTLENVNVDMLQKASTRKASNLVMEHGSLDAVMEGYLSDLAMFFLRKLPRGLQGQCKLEQRNGPTGPVFEIKGAGLVTSFALDKNRHGVEAVVNVEPQFSFGDRAARGNRTHKTFSIDSSESAIKLIAQVLSFLGTF